MKIKSLFLKKIYNISSKISQDIYLYQENNFIVCQAIQDGNTALIEIIHKVECKKTNEPIVFPLLKIKNLISTLQDDDIVNIDIKEEYISFKTKGFTRTVRLITPEKNRFTFPDENKDKKLIFTYDIDIFASFLKDSINASRDIEGDIKFIFDKNGLRINKQTNIDEFNSNIEKNNITINSASKQFTNIYNQEYIMNFLSNIDGKINIKTIESGPIKISTSPIKDLTFKYMVAPLIPNEDAE